MVDPTVSNLDQLSDLIQPFDQAGMNLDLERIQLALQAMGNPCHSIPAIQVVGTNGKGSIASFLHSGLKAAGIRSGLTTSPHLVSWCERIRVDEQQISTAELRQRLTALQPLRSSHRLTPFELLMAAAFDHFAASKVELLVLEVGLGGRLDATTAHPYRPVIAFASIGLDHCEHLGSTLKQIAAEKAAVISPGAVVISGPQHPEVTKLLNDAADQQAAQIHWVTPLTDEWELGLPGLIQRQNAAVAKGALESLAPMGWLLSEATLRKGFAQAQWPGRLQTTRWQDLPLLIDGAHNPHAAKQLALERQQWPGEEQGIQWILGIQAHKDAAAILRYLIKPADRAWIVPVTNHRSWTSAALATACQERSHQIIAADNVEQALSQLLAEGAWPNPPPVIAGSLYLLGDLMAEQTITPVREAR